MRFILSVDSIPSASTFLRSDAGPLLVKSVIQNLVYVMVHKDRMTSFGCAPCPRLKSGLVLPSRSVTSLYTEATFHVERWWFGL